MPLIVVANSPDKEAALAGLERWKSKHAEAAEASGRGRRAGRFHARPVSTWTRIRVNLRHVPEAAAAAAGDARSGRRSDARMALRRRASKKSARRA